MFLIISIFICSVLCIVSYYFTISAMIKLSGTVGPAYRSLCLKKLLYGFIIRISVVIYWLLFLEKFKVLVSVISLFPEIITLSMIILYIGYEIVDYLYEVIKDCYIEKINKKEQNQ